MIPALAANVSDTLWSMDKLVALVYERDAAKPRQEAGLEAEGTIGLTESADVEHTRDAALSRGSALPRVGVVRITNTKNLDVNGSDWRHRSGGVETTELAIVTAMDDPNVPDVQPGERFELLRSGRPGFGKAADGCVLRKASNQT